MHVRQLVRPIHPSWMVAWASAGIVTGVAFVGMSDDVMFASPAWLLAGIVMFTVTLIRRPAWMIGLALLAGCLIGLYRGSMAHAGLEGYNDLKGTLVQVKGVVRDDVDRDARGRAVVRLSDVRIEGKRLPGMVWVTVPYDERVRRSDHVALTGKLRDGFGGFTAAMHDARIVYIHRESPGDIALSVRDWFAGGVIAVLDEPEESLGLGYLLGMRRGLAEDFNTALIAAGLTHVVVASGYNLTILVRAARRAFERISKYLSFVVASGLIVGFVAVTGASPSMSRASLVAGLALLAWYYGRRIHPLVLLPFAMAVTVLLQPQYAWGDVGWQLSFAAFAGVMLLAPLLRAYFLGDKKEHPIRRIFVETVAAQLATLPILLLSFGSFSMIAPLSNILILPFVPLAMLLTFIAGLAGVFMPLAIAAIIALPAEWLLTYMTQIVQWAGGLAWSVQELSLDIVGAFAMYGALIVWGIWMWHATRLDLAKTSLVE